MHQVTSADGTPIAYERRGDGGALVLVAGALCDRSATRPLADELAGDFTVVNYDRRGRGDSGDTSPYAVAREVDDLAALIQDCGGRAAVYGHSSGAGLALHAAASGLPIDRLVLHEAPFSADDADERAAARDFEDRVVALLAEDRRAEALQCFLASAGMPPEMVEGMSADPATRAMAPTLAYDLAVMNGEPPGRLASRVRVPTLVLLGGESPRWMADAGAALTAAVPGGRAATVEGHGHVVPPAALAPVLTRFLTAA